MHLPVKYFCRNFNIRSRMLWSDKVNAECCKIYCNYRYLFLQLTAILVLQKLCPVTVYKLNNTSAHVTAADVNPKSR